MPLKGTLSGGYTMPVTLDNRNDANPVTGAVSLASPGIDLAAASTWTIANAAGVKLPAGGHAGSGGLTNAGATASGIDRPVPDALGTVTNAGTITITNTGSIGSLGVAIEVSGSGAVSNLATGTIVAGSAAIQAIATYVGNPFMNYYANLTVYNAGTISNSGTLNTPTLYNPAIRGAPGRLVVTNAAGGLIGSGYQGIAGASGAVPFAGFGVETLSSVLYNAGTILTDGQSFDGFSVSNAAGGIISSAGSLAVYAQGAVTNAGTIAAFGANAEAVKLAPGRSFDIPIAPLVPRLIVDPGAEFIGAVDGGQTAGASIGSVLELAAGAGTLGGGTASSVINFGTVQFDPGAAWTLVEAPTGMPAGQMLSGFAPGDTLELAAVSDTIAGFANGTLTLAGSAPVSLRVPGAYIAAQFSATTVAGNTNLALALGGRTISQTAASGVTLTNSADNAVVVTGTVDTGSGTAVTGTAPVNWTIDNAGLVRATGTEGDGIALAAGGTVVDSAGARIAGALYGVSITDGPGTVATGGSIAGATAVRLAPGYANRVIMGPGALFSGLVDGGNAPGASAVSTLELVSGATQGVLSGLGANYVDFGMVTVDAGATWSLGGTNSIAAGVTLAITGSLEAGTLANAGSIADAGSLYLNIANPAGASFSNLAGGIVSSSNPGDAVTLSTGLFTNAGTLVSSDSALLARSSGATVANRAGGTIAAFGSDAGYAVHGLESLDNAGLLRSDGTTVVAVYGLYAVNRSGGVIAGEGAGIDVVKSMSNDGTITAGSAGIAALIGGMLTNGAAGTIAGGLSGTLTPGLTINGNFDTTFPAGVVLENLAQLTNSGHISGYVGVLIGGNAVGVTNAAGAVISGGVMVQAGDATVTNAGTIAATPGGGKAVAFVSQAFYDPRPSVLIVDQGAVFVGSVDGGQTAGATNSAVLELAPGSGTLTGFGTQFYNFGTIAVDPVSNWLIAGSKAGLAGGQTISGFAPGCTVELTGVDATYSGFGGGVLTLSDGTNVLFEGAFTGDHFVVTPGTDTDITVACFAAGTRILTAAGEVPVERLRIGDRVPTLGGYIARIAWIGHRHAANAALVRVAANAFAAGVPHRTLYLSPDHAVFVNGALVPVRCLVNGAGVLACESADIGYWHVELAAHDVMFADGLACESYLDTGNRAGMEDKKADPTEAGFRRFAQTQT